MSTDSSELEDKTPFLVRTYRLIYWEGDDQHNQSLDADDLPDALKEAAQFLGVPEDEIDADIDPETPVE
jgi:hypothetical protein